MDENRRAFLKGAGALTAIAAIGTVNPARAEAKRERKKESGIESVVTAGYAILDLITFYTLVGKELRAWTLPSHSTAYAAAGKIHSDMQKGFIKAEVISYEHFVQCGSEQAARERGLVSVEGKEHIVKDGDILHIGFIG
jgi:ribosome-binding ATPase YchF (GTP1/OBG family)